MNIWKQNYVRKGLTTKEIHLGNIFDSPARLAQVSALLLVVEFLIFSFMTKLIVVTGATGQYVIS